MESEATIIWGVLFGAIGMGYLMYAKQQRRGIALAAGVGLIVVPYFMPGVWSLLLVGALLVAAPWFLRF